MPHIVGKPRRKIVLTDWMDMDAPVETRAHYIFDDGRGRTISWSDIGDADSWLPRWPLFIDLTPAP